MLPFDRLASVLTQRIARAVLYDISVFVTALARNLETGVAHKNAAGIQTAKPSTYCSCHLRNSAGSCCIR